MWGSIPLQFWFTFPQWLVMLTIFSCTFWPFVYLLRRNVYLCLVLFMFNKYVLLPLESFLSEEKIRWKYKNWNQVESGTHAQFLFPLALTCRPFPGDSEAGGPWLGRAWLAHASVRTYVMVTSMAYGADVRVSGHTKRIPSKDTNVFRVKHFRRNWMEISLPGVCQFAPLFWRHGKTPS